MSEIWPETTADEKDPRDDRDDEEEEKRRIAEIQADKPPHHE